MLSFLVSLNEAEAAEYADFSARCRGAMGSSRLIVLLGAADWIVYVSKMLSCRGAVQGHVR